jgi:hypothetical protein
MNKDKFSGDFMVDGVDNIFVNKVEYTLLKDFYGENYINELKMSYELNYDFEQNIKSKLIGMNIDDGIYFLKEMNIDYINGNNGFQGNTIGAPLSKVVLYSKDNIINRIEMTTEYMNEIIKN